MAVIFEFTKCIYIASGKSLLFQFLQRCFFVFCFFIHLFYLFIYLFFGCIESLLPCVGFLKLSRVGDYPSMWCTGFSLRWLLLLRSTGSRRAGFSSCGTRAQSLRGTWDPPRPGLKPVSPALAGRFLTTAPPGKPLQRCLKWRLNLFSQYAFDFYQNEHICPY